MSGGREYSTAERRLLFWLWTPYLSDAALIGIGLWIIAGGDDGGWWAIAFAGVRSVIGTAALLLAYRTIAQKKSATDKG